MSHTIISAGSAAEYAPKVKYAKYSALEPMYDFVPVAVKTAGAWAAETQVFIGVLGRRLKEMGCDPRSGFY